MRARQGSKVSRPPELTLSEVEGHPATSPGKLRPETWKLPLLAFELGAGNWELEAGGWEPHL